MERMDRQLLVLQKISRLIVRKLSSLEVLKSIVDLVVEATSAAARRGVDVTLLEVHHDFDRDFRGDTIHPSVLEMLDHIGSDRLHQIRHSRIYGAQLQTTDGPFQPFDFRALRTRFPYIMVMPQTKFLEFLTVASANVSAEPLLAGDMSVRHLAKVQRRRQFPTRVIQTIQAFVQKRLLHAAGAANENA